MRTLGIVLAGGRSSRFGSDKADALLAGRPLLDHAIEALRPHCDLAAVAGREVDGIVSIADWPAPDAGPLGGLAGALRHALANGFDQVLSVPVDAALLPADLRASLEPAPACLASQPVIGLWPVTAADAVGEILANTGSHSLRAFAERIGARLVASAAAPANINTPHDLARLERHHGL
jgi:molybdopterin-guanine dinucleotide biosynthesis protein A